MANCTNAWAALERHGVATWPPLIVIASEAHTF
jgi:hypothetical protein